MIGEFSEQKSPRGLRHRGFSLFKSLLALSPQKSFSYLHVVLASNEEGSLLVQR